MRELSVTEMAGVAGGNSGQRTVFERIGPVRILVGDVRDSVLPRPINKPMVDPRPRFMGRVAGRY